MRWWTTLCLALPACVLQAQYPHLPVPPQGSPARVQLVGTVTDSLTGKPVYDCLVEYYGTDGLRYSIASVNSDGRYAMFVPAGKSFELRIIKEDGYKDLRQPMDALAEGLGQRRQDLLLQPRP